MDTSLNNTAVLFVDIINDFDFDGGDDLYRNTKAILPNLIKLKKFAKEKIYLLFMLMTITDYGKQTFIKLLKTVKMIEARKLLRHSHQRKMITFLLNHSILPFSRRHCNLCLQI